MYAAHHPLAREFRGTGLERHASLGYQLAEQVTHQKPIVCVSAWIGQVTLHVVDARGDVWLDLAGPQTPEVTLRGAHVRTSRIFDALGQAVQTTQRLDRLFVGAEGAREAQQRRLAIGLRRGHLGRGSRALQLQE